MKIYINNFDQGLHTIEEAVNTEDLGLPDDILLKSPVKIIAHIDKFENSFRLKVDMKAIQTNVCDRCLENYQTDFEGNIEQIYQIGSGQFDDSEDVNILPGDTKEIDISDLLFSLVYLNKTIKNLCRNDCKGLCMHCGINLNNSGCSCENSQIDPRLEKLKMFIKKE